MGLGGLGFGFGSGIGFRRPPGLGLAFGSGCKWIRFWVWMDEVSGLGGVGFGIGCHEGIQGWNWDWV